MQPSVTQDWSRFQFKRGESATRGFIATGYADADSARAACPIQKGNTFDMDTRLIAGEPGVATPRGPQNYVIDVNFAPTGTGGDDTSDQVNQPPQYAIDFQDTTEPVDRESKTGLAMTNSCFKPYAQNPTREFVDTYLIYKRYESRVDGPKLIAFNNSVNDAPLDLPGLGRIDKGQGKLKIRVPKDFQKTSKAIFHTYIWRVREDGWKTRNLDKGREAYWYDGSNFVLGAIYLRKAAGEGRAAVGEAVTEDVLLDGTGGVLHPELYVISKEGKNPTTGATGLSAAELEKTATGVFLRYEIYDLMPHSSLAIIP